MISTTPTTGQKIQVWGYPGMEVDLGTVSRAFSDEEFLDFCRRHPDARIERESNGEIVLMAPTYTETGGQNATISYFVTSWARKDGTGRSFGSSSGFTLPNGALRAPDASWISNARWSSLSDEQQKGFAKVCPDFVIELRSQSETMNQLKAKIAEYIENGAMLGWLIDPDNREVHVYRPNAEPEIFNDPVEVSGEPVLPGFVLKLNEIWD